MKNRKLTLGSLFDGSGGFPLAASLCGIEPVWASEIEPYPIAVTKSRFPSMKHYGDISKINGAEIEPVDIITFGSPCQDLSVAGKRAGLKHEENGDEETTRSGLFIDAIRIIKEMRNETKGLYPTFLIWENVTGAFSSNRGEDFRTVLEEFVKIAEPAAIMPPVPKEGYADADCFCGDGFSLAYRVFDAQYWGVAQRRKRIYLVLDLGGERAKEILFERKGLQGDYREKFKTWEGTSRSSEKSVGETGAGDRIKSSAGFCTEHSAQSRSIGYEEETSPTLRAGVVPATIIKEEPIVLESSQVHATVTNTGVCPTLKAAMGEGGGHTPMIVDTKEKYAAGFCPEESAKTRSIGYEEEKSPTLRASHTPAVVKEEPIAFDEYDFTSTGSITETLRTSKTKMPIVFENHGKDVRYKEPIDTCTTLTASYGTGGNNQPFVVFRKTSHAKTKDDPQGYEEAKVADTLNVFDTGETRTPMLVATPKTLKIRSGKEGGGKGVLIQDNRSATLGCSNDQTLFQPKTYGISSYESNAMKSPNPQAGIYEATTSRTLDCSGGNPACNQGGIAIVERKEPVLYQKKIGAICARDSKAAGNQYVSEDKLIVEKQVFNVGNGSSDCDIKVVKTLDTKCGDPFGNQGGNVVAEKTYVIQGNAIGRHEKNGPAGKGWNEDVCFTLNTVDVPAVTAEKTANIYSASKASYFTSAMNDKANTLKDPPIVNQPEYIVRRLTPTECARLQGFPDWWGIIEYKEDMSDEEYAFWLGVRNTHTLVINGKEPKNYPKKQIITWYNKLHNDSSEYKMWGNGVALPCVLYVMQGIVKETEGEICAEEEKKAA